MTTNIVATLTEKGLSLVVDGEPAAINKSHINFNKIIDALREKDYDSIPDLLDVVGSIAQYTEGLVTIENETVLFNGEEMHNSLSRRMLDMMRLGLEIDHLAKFLNRLMKNPSNHSVTQLYDFMEACDLPITPDGRLLCYKSVNDDYMDTHTGRTYRNAPGDVVEMSRNRVNDNPDITCSHGLHVCSQKYGMYGRRLMLVAVDPADVVSVPRDYNQAKMRVCRYEVLKDVQHEGFKTFEDTPVYDDDEIDWNMDGFDRDDEEYFFEF
jgi:hypothetical protein